MFNSQLSNFIVECQYKIVFLWYFGLLCYIFGVQLLSINTFVAFKKWKKSDLYLTDMFLFKIVPVYSIRSININIYTNATDMGGQYQDIESSKGYGTDQWKWYRRSQGKYRFHGPYHDPRAVSLSWVIYINNVWLSLAWDDCDIDFLWMYHKMILCAV